MESSDIPTLKPWDGKPLTWASKCDNCGSSGPSHNAGCANSTLLPLTDKQSDLGDAIADFIDAHPDCTQDCFETIRTLLRRSAEQSKDSACAYEFFSGGVCGAPESSPIHHVGEVPPQPLPLPHQYVPSATVQALELALDGPHSPESTEPAAAQAVPTEASAGAAPGPSLPRCGFCRKEYDPALDNDPIARLRKATKGAFDRCSGACGGMPWLDTPPPADYAGLSAEERMAVELRESLESADVESIADLHAQAQATIEGLSEQMRPHQIAANVTRQLLFERLLARGGRKLLHDALDIEMKPKTETVITDEDAIQELLTVKIDGKPIPADLLDPAIRFEEVPATTKLRTNLTHIKTLVKDIGGVVRDIFDRATITRTSYVMTIKPKPKAKA